MSKKIFKLAFGSFLVTGIILLSHYHHQINPDGISYITIAKKYLRGDFSNAINGYWGPLLSWLLVPFLFLKLPSLVAARLVLLLTGALTLKGIIRLSASLDLEETTRTVLVLSLIPIVLYFSFFMTTSDLLVTCFLVYYYSLIFDKHYGESGDSRKGFFCGLLGGLAYLSKAYALPFFFGHFLIINIYYWFIAKGKKEKKNILRNLTLGLAVFVFLSGFWSALISVKYGFLTFSTAGSINYARVGPEAKGPPYEYQGFLPPPNETAVAANEDPINIEIIKWSPFSSLENLNHQKKIIFSNLSKTISLIQSFSLFSIAIIIGAGVSFALFLSSGIKVQRNIPFLFLTTFLLFLSGYLVFSVEERYLWPNFIFLILMGGYLLDKLFEGKKNRLFLIKYILTSAFALSVVIFPLRQYKKYSSTIGSGKDINSLSKRLSGIKGNIGSNSNWHASLYLSYSLESRYYGMPKKGISYEELENELKKKKIDYYFIWGLSQDNQFFLKKYREVTGGEIQNLRIYSLRQPL